MLRFVDCKTSSAGVHLVTEHVVPLTVDYMEEITEDEILVGLYDIMVIGTDSNSIVKRTPSRKGALALNAERKRD